MKTEDLFKFGVTPKEGPRSGEKFEVYSIDRDGVFVRDEKGNRTHFDDGEYTLWSPPKTVFDDDSIELTLGSLKKAAEERGLSDNTVILRDKSYVSPFYFSFDGDVCKARARAVKKYTEDGKDREAILIF